MDKEYLKSKGITIISWQNDRLEAHDDWNDVRHVFSLSNKLEDEFVENEVEYEIDSYREMMGW